MSRNKRTAVELMEYLLRRSRPPGGLDSRGARRRRHRGSVYNGRGAESGRLVFPDLGLGGAKPFVDAEDQLDRTDLYLVAGRQDRPRLDPCAAHERAVLAAEILNRHLAPQRDHAGVVPRHLWRVETDRHARLAANDVIAVGEPELEVAADQPAAGATALESRHRDDSAGREPVPESVDRLQEAIGP